jgi:glycosyltransferase involved in cell wall biosynthesis
MQYELTIDARMIDASGVGRYIRSLLPFLGVNKGFSITLLGNEDDLNKHGLLNSDRIRVVECNAKIYSLKEQFELAIKIPTACDLFWSPHYNTPLLPIRARKRLVTIHDVFHLAFLNMLTLQQKAYARLMFNASARLSHKIITDSEFSKSEIIRYTGIDAGKLRVVPCGIDKKTFKLIEDKESLQHIKLSYNLPEQFILFVGNLKPHKNLTTLLKAFDILINEKAVDCGLVIVGKKEGFISGDSDIHKMIENSRSLRERVTLTGYIADKDVPVIYNLASVFVLPSLYEGFGLPPLEAMACGCPAIVSDIASIREVCGDAAYYVDPYDADHMAQGIYEVLSDETLRQYLKQKGAERSKLFSWEDSGGKLTNIFMEVMGE